MPAASMLTQQLPQCAPQYTEGPCGPRKSTANRQQDTRGAYLGHCRLSHDIVVPEMVGQVDEVNDGVVRDMEPVYSADARILSEGACVGVHRMGKALHRHTNGSVASSLQPLQGYQDAHSPERNMHSRYLPPAPRYMQHPDTADCMRIKKRHRSAGCSEVGFGACSSNAHVTRT